MNNIRSFLYRNAEHADDLADLDLGTDPADVLKGAHSVWNQRFEELYKKDFNFARSDAGEELLYSEACKLVRPYKGLFKGTITGNDFLFIGEGVLAAEGYVPDKRKAGYGYQCRDGTMYGREFWSRGGVFLSALLNETDLEKMAVDWYPARLWGLGYRLKDDKTVILGPEGRVLEFGEKAEGGVTLVYGEVMRWLAQKASGGLHINLGERSRHTASEPLYNRCSHVPGEFELNIGEQALGGTYINFGMCGDMGKSASGGTFIQLGQIAQGSYDIGNNARNAVCVGARHPEYDSHYANHNVSEFELKYGKDETLRGLLGELKSGWPFSADDDVDAPKIKDIARKVDAHVRGKYGRRVA